MQVEDGSDGTKAPLGRRQGASKANEKQTATHIGARLAKRRKALSLTQAQIGHLVGASHQTIQKYECGEVVMSATCLWLLANALGVDISYFFEGLAPLAGREGL